MKTIVLAGSGHAHLEVIRLLSKKEIAAQRFILISPQRETYYSGMIPRLIMNEIGPANLTIQSAHFAESKGLQFIQDSIQSIDETETTISLASGESLHFDLLSLNIGGSAKAIPSKSPLGTIYLRPLNKFIDSLDEVEKMISTGTNPRFVIVGGGAAAVEVATALRLRLNRSQKANGEVHLVSKGSRLCENYTERISASIQKKLLTNQVEVHLQETVTEIQSHCIELSNGRKLEFDSIFVLTPTEPSNLTSRGTDSMLRISSNIFSVGDCAQLKGHLQLPRSGVTAVHQGRHLAQTLRRILQQKKPMPFINKRNQLSILISGENSARLIWGDFSFEGFLPLRIKNWIDETYMKGFNSKPKP